MINFTGPFNTGWSPLLVVIVPGMPQKKCHDDSGLGLVGKFANKIAEDEVVQVVHFH